MMQTKTLDQEWGENLRSARAELRLSLFAVAVRAEVDPGHLSKAERGLARFGDEARMRLSAVLGHTVAELFPYPDQETECRPAASATALGSSETPATVGATRSPVRSAAARDASAPTATPSTDEAVA